jgi:hypothetical protein
VRHGQPLLHHHVDLLTGPRGDDIGLVRLRRADRIDVDPDPARFDEAARELEDLRGLAGDGA